MNFLDGQNFEGKLYLSEIIETNREELAQTISAIHLNHSKNLYFLRYEEKNNIVFVMIYEVLFGTMEQKSHKVKLVPGP